MLRLKARQLSVLVEKVPDVANLGVGALVFGQFVGGQRFSVRIAVAGLVIWIVLIEHDALG